MLLALLAYEYNELEYFLNMKIQIFSTISCRRRVLGAGPVANSFTSFLIPGQASYELNQTDREVLVAPDIEHFYRALRFSISQNDYLGFEDAAEPLYIDAMPSQRLHAEFPKLLDLRKSVANKWSQPVHFITSDVLHTYESMRAKYDVEATNIFHILFERVDLAIPGSSYGFADRFRLAHLNPGWDIFTFIVRQCGVFSDIPETFFNIEFWPFTNSFVMKSDLLAPFLEAFFESAVLMHRLRPEIDCYDFHFMFPRLLAIYICYLKLQNGLLKIAHIPTLRAKLASLPSEVPVDFNDEIYLRLNRDVAEAGVPARTHYLSAGWREDRYWGLA